jgi:hypothetical protein
LRARSARVLPSQLYKARVDLTLTLRVPPSFPPISLPPPLPSSSLQFHVLPHTRPILSISSLFFQSSSSSSNPRNKIFRNVNVTFFQIGPSAVRPFRLPVRSMLGHGPNFSCLFTTFRPLLISFLFFDSLALPLPNQNDVSTFHSLLPPAHIHIIHHLPSGQNFHLRPESASAVALQPIVLWENGYRSWMQRME